MWIWLYVACGVKVGKDCKFTIIEGLDFDIRVKVNKMSEKWKRGFKSGFSY